MIAENIANINDDIGKAIARRMDVVGISHEVKLIAVTKNHDIEAMQKAVDAGVLSVGENRLQEAQAKYNSLQRHVEWHLIGHLQTNKVKQAVNIFDLIHSVDSERLVKEIDRAAGVVEKRQDILIQVNFAHEETKFGIDAKNVITFANLISTLPHVRLRGLMTIAPYFANVESTRPIFREAYNKFIELRDAHIPNTDILYLSMGMTNDYVVAIEEGANIVRIGTGIFGERKYI